MGPPRRRARGLCCAAPGADEGNHTESARPADREKKFDRVAAPATSGAVGISLGRLPGPGTTLPRAFASTSMSSSAGEVNKKRALEVRDALTLRLASLDSPGEVPGGEPMAHVAEAAAAVEREATKIGMVFSDGNGAPADAAGSALDHFESSVLTFLTVACRALGSQGATFDEVVRRAATKVSQSCRNLVVVATESPVPSNWLKPTVGEVWEACRDIKKLPKDGRTAVSHQLLASAALIKDVSVELSEIGAGGEDGEGERDDGERAPMDEDDMLFVDEDFSAEEMRVAKSCAAFAAASLQFMRDLVAPVVRGSASDATSLERALTECRAFQREVEEIGAGVYPPQDVDDIAARAGRAMDRARAMAGAVAEAGGVEGADTATTALEGARERLRETLADAGAKDA